MCYFTWTARWNISIDRPCSYHDFHSAEMWNSEVANYNTEIHIAKYNKRGDVVSCNVTTIEHEGEKCKSSVF